MHKTFITLGLIICSTLAFATLPAGKAQIILSNMHSIDPSISTDKQCSEGLNKVIFNRGAKVIKIAHRTIYAIHQTKVQLLNGMQLVNGNALITVAGPAPYRSNLHWYGVENKGSTIAYGAISDNVCSGNYTYDHGPKIKQ